VIVKQQADKRKAIPQSTDWFSWIFKNLAVGSVVFLLIFAVKQRNLVITMPDGSQQFGGYRWAYEILAKENYHRIRELLEMEKTGQVPPLTREFKLGQRVACYGYLDYLVKNTPDTAVILLPPYSVIEGNNNLNFLYAPDWVEYFVYPRLCTAEMMKDREPELLQQATHVAIVNGWGYDQLKWEYPDSNRPQMAVLPIHSPPVNP